MATTRPISRTRTYPAGKQDARVPNKTRILLTYNDSSNQGEGDPKDNNYHHADTSNTIKNDRVLHVRTKARRALKNHSNDTDQAVIKVRTKRQRKVQRTDSYKIATNRRQSLDYLENTTGNDLLNESMSCTRLHKPETKYKAHTMPCRIDPSFSNGEFEFTSKKGKIGNRADEKVHKRKAPQKSGVSKKSGSSGTNGEIEGPSSEGQGRKKKSIFRIMKERLFQTFNRKRKTEKHLQETNGKRLLNIDSKDFTPANNRYKGSTCIRVSIEDSDMQLEHMRHAGDTLVTSVDSCHYLDRSDPVDIPKFAIQSHVEIENEEVHVQIGSSNKANISDIFGSLIDPGTPFLTYNSHLRPDKSKLKLDGLNKYRPKSFEQDKNYNGSTRNRDHAYGSVKQTSFSYSHTDTEIGEMSQSELSVQNDDYLSDTFPDSRRRLLEYGRRLKAVGDRLIAERVNELVEDEEQQCTTMEELVNELKICADDENKELLRQGDVHTSILPRIKRLATAPDYTRFKQIMVQELSNTIQWKQVAWYTYLIKITMSVVGTGKDLGKKVQENATRYFHSHIQPWIESRPNGWESMYEETDIDDSELD